MNQTIIQTDIQVFDIFANCSEFLGSNMDGKIVSLYIVEPADTDLTSPHLAQPGHYLKSYSSVWYFIFGILISFRALTGGSQMDENFLSL